MLFLDVHNIPLNYFWVTLKLSYLQDFDEITVDYPSIQDLMKDLKGMIIFAIFSCQSLNNAWSDNIVIVIVIREFTKPGRQRQPERHLIFCKRSIVSVRYF